MKRVGRFVGVRLRVAFTIFAGLLLEALVPTSSFGDETHARYFEQLRERGLYSLAESDAISRLAADDLPLVLRTDFTIELSRTLTEHAGFVAADQRNELWQRAQSLITDLLQRELTNPRSILLKVQLGSVYVAESDWLRWERELNPYDATILNQGRDLCSKAIEQLKSAEKSLTEPARDAGKKGPAAGALQGYELRAAIHQSRLLLGAAYRIRAELSPLTSEDRVKDLTDAEQSLRRLIGVADDPVQFRAKLLLVACTRLKHQLEKAMDGLDVLEAADAKASDPARDAIAAERVRLLLEMKRPTEAAEVVLKTRARRQRLTGELWYLQTRSLIALRAISLEKQQQSLATGLAEQINTTIQRCEEQVGGYWSRRCLQLWENTQTSQKYGAELDGLMQQARADFTAGRIDTALAAYATAERLASEKQQPTLAMDLGFTRASILLDQLQFEPAAGEFFRLASTYPMTERTAKSHLLGAYCLGRLYDEKKTAPRRAAYTQALDQHLKDYAADSTVNDARIMKGQFEEQRLQATAALPLYLQVDPGHPRMLEAMAGAARCYEAVILRMIERQLDPFVIQKEAIERLTAYLKLSGEGPGQWVESHADIALRLANILLLSTREPSKVSAPRPSSAVPREYTIGPFAIAQYGQAERWLSQVVVFTERKDLGAEKDERISQLRRRAELLLVLAYAGSGNVAQAERALNSLKTSPMSLLTIVDRLTELVQMNPEGHKSPVTSLHMQAVERLAKQREQLAPAEQLLLDRCLTRAYLAQQRYQQAVELGRVRAERATKDVELQQEIAQIFSETANPAALLLAKQCWQRVEALAKAGSSEWMLARLAVLKTSLQLGQLEECQKLLQVTKVLYPDLGGEALKTQFEAFGRELADTKTPKK